MWSTLSLKKSLLVIYKIFPLLVNTLITDDEYSLLNNDKLTQPIQIQIAKKEKKTFYFFSRFFKSTSNFEHCEKEDDPQSLYVFQITGCERRSPTDA